jgi:predicted ATP-grasp superfamily ATP-dependent carboligase
VPALILDPAGARASLAGARALAAAGWRVGVASPAGGGLASASRHVRARHVVPAAAAGEERFAAGLQRVIGEGGYDVVFAATDADLLALSGVRARLSAIVPHPPHATLLRALDKAQLTAAALRAGLAVPRTAATGDLTALRPPLVVKERLHGDRGAGAGAPLDAEVAGDAAAARTLVRRLRARGSDAVVQELVRGRLVALTVVCDRDARPVARLQQEALRTWPGEIGRSVRARSVAVDEGLAAGVARLLAELGWFGLAQLQFIATADGPPRLIDLNARFYGSLALALGAGVNLPATWAQLAVGRRPPARDGAPGARYQWLESDLRQARQERRGASVWAGALGCLAWGCGAHHSTWAATDPGPAARALAELMGGRGR